MYEKINSKHFIQWKTEKISSKIRNETWMYTFTTLIQYSTSVLDRINLRVALVVQSVA